MSHASDFLHSSQPPLQAFTVKVLEELGFPREIIVAPATETTDRDLPVAAHAPHVVGDIATIVSMRATSSPPLPERFPSQRDGRHGTSLLTEN